MACRSVSRSWAGRATMPPSSARPPHSKRSLSGSIFARQLRNLPLRRGAFMTRTSRIQARPRFSLLVVLVLISALGSIQLSGRAAPPAIMQDDAATPAAVDDDRVDLAAIVLDAADLPDGSRLISE